MTRPVVYIDECSRWSLKGRRVMVCVTIGVIAVVTWWAMTSATAEHMRMAEPAMPQWAGSASPFTPVSAGATTPVLQEPAPAAVVMPTLLPAAVVEAPRFQVAPMSPPVGMAAAPAEPEPENTDYEN
jgi:hypothetical protein